MASRAEEMIAALDRIGDAREALDVARAFGEPEEVAELLWQGIASGKLEAGRHRTVLPLLAGAPGAWGLEDFCAVVRSLEANHPGDAVKHDLYGRWHVDHTMAGSEASLALLVEEKLSDPSFIADLKAALSTLPGPWRAGIAHCLVEKERLSPAAFSDDWLDDIAPWFVGAVYWNAPSPVRSWCPPARWAEAVGRACASLDARPDGDYETIFRHLSPHPDPAVVVEALQWCRLESDLAITLEAIRGLSAKALPHYEAAIRRLDIVPLDDNDRESIWPAPALLFGYLHCCLQAGHEPTEDLDPIFVRMLDCIAFRWSGGQIQELHALMQDAMAALKPARQDALVLASSAFPWWLVPGCPTPAILQATVDNLLTMKRPKRGEQYDLQSIIGWLEGEGSSYYDQVGVLHRIREPLIPYITAGLKKKKSAPLRRVFVNLLLACRDPAAGEALLLLLSDSARGNRTAAVQALQALRPPGLRPKVAALARDGRSKPAREAAEAVLSGWPQLPR